MTLQNCVLKLVNHSVEAKIDKQQPSQSRQYILQTQHQARHKVEKQIHRKGVMGQPSQHLIADMQAFNRVQVGTVTKLCYKDMNVSGNIYTKLAHLRMSLFPNYAMRSRRQPTTLQFNALHRNSGDCQCWNPSIY